MQRTGLIVLALVSVTDNNILCFLGTTQHVPCHAVLSLPHKDQRAWHAQVYFVSNHA